MCVQSFNFVKYYPIFQFKNKTIVKTAHSKNDDIFLMKQ